MNPLVDIFITTKDRHALLEKSLKSLFDSVQSTQVRVSVVIDGMNAQTFHVVDSFSRRGFVDHILCHTENIGLAPSMNQALAHIDALNLYYGHATHGDASCVSDFTCYCQDDIVYEKGWLTKLMRLFLMFEKKFNIGFATGATCPEHPVRAKIADGIVLKNWIRATQMFARREYWMSMYPIPRFDVETGNVRAKPNDGIGSGVDWHFIRDHKNSVCNTNRTCLVIPGMVKHIGYKESTWLKKELPETDSDLAEIEEELAK
jgi:glycosyltransferase involved in cell wall biosynthesis